MANDRPDSSGRQGLSLVELLLVIAIISLLLQLSLPGIQSSRESSRQVGCLNNLRQMALAAQLHLETHGHFPTGGWTSVYTGDPNRGFGKDQPAGWCYNLLPYLEQESLHDLGKGTSESQRLAEAAKVFAVPVSVFVCPSRRPVVAWPFARVLFNADHVDAAGRGDYAANMGNFMPSDQRGPGPKTYDQADDWLEGTDRLAHWVATHHNGIVFQRSVVRANMVTDGLSKSYLFGEKFLSPAHYEDGESHGDDQSLYIGFDRDTARSTNELHPPIRDALLESVWLPEGDTVLVLDWNFGSAHPNGLHMASCDGSVGRIAYDIDPAVFIEKGSRDSSEAAVK
ncbi:MAG: DUF1559 domain-containing protein [Pirellulales bacterium]